MRGRKGEYRKELRRAAEEGLPARQDRRRDLRDRRGAGARQEVQARHRRGGRPHRGASPTSRTACRVDRDRAAGSPKGSARSSSPIRRRDAKRAVISRERFACPVSGLHASPSSSPGCSRSTRRSVPARNATGSARAACRRRRWSIPDSTLEPCGAARSPRGPDRRHVALLPQTLKRSPSVYKFSHRRPPGRTSASSREVDALRLGRRGDKLRYDDGVRQLQDQEAFEGVLANIARRWRETESDWVREDLSRMPSRHAVRGLRAAIA